MCILIKSLSFTAYVTRKRDMKTYLIWKRDSNAEGRQSRINLRQVEQDGITFRDEWKNVTLVTANYSTEKMVIEGPWIIYRYLNTFYLIRIENIQQRAYKYGFLFSASSCIIFNSLSRIEG